MRRRKNKEEQLQMSVSKYIKLKWPNVIFTAESSGVRVHLGTAIRMKAQRSAHKLPDMIILEPRGGYYGLILELKRSEEEIYKKDGSYRKSEHIEEQARTLQLLQDKGYYAIFSCGIDESIKIVDWYMNQEATNNP